MSSSRGVAFALVGVSLGAFGITLSILGLANIQEGSSSFDVFPYFGVLVALIGVVISLISAIITEDNHG
jgi:hypothetical protein